jgi:hypothetical protein
MHQRVDGKIDVEFRPVQVMRTRQLNAADLFDRSFLEPREILERHEQFPLADKDPKAMR